MIFTSPRFLSGLPVRRILCAAGCSAVLTLAIVYDFVRAQSSSPALVTIHKRLREETADGTYAMREKTEKWNPNQTAIIVCDMWDAHQCLNAVRRAEEMAPRMNQVLENARSRGVLIVHAPSSCMEPYKDHPARRRAQEAPAGREPARGHWRVVPEDSIRGKGKISDRPVGRRRG